MGKNMIVLAGGVSSRMKKSVQEITPLEPNLANDVRYKPKAMIRLGHGGRPFLDYLLYNIEAAGYRSLVIVVGDGDPSICDHYCKGGDNGRFRDLAIRCVPQRIPPGRQKPLGTADALLQALMAVPQWRGSRFTVCNSDNVYSKAVLACLLEDQHDNAMIDYERNALSFSPERIEQFAVIKRDAEGFLEEIIEKPSNDEIHRAADSSGRVGVSMNIFRFTYEQIFPYLERVPLHPVRSEKELPVAVRMMIAEHPQSMYAIPASEHVIDLTSPGDIGLVQEFLRREFPDLDS